MWNRTQQAPHPFLWKWIAIIAIIIAMAMGAFSAATIATRGEVGSVASEGLDSIATQLREFATTEKEELEYAPTLRAGMNANRALLTQPGNPEEIVNFTQVVSSFALLSSRGYIDEAMGLVAPEAQPHVRELAEWIHQTRPDKQEVKFSGYALKWGEDDTIGFSDGLFFADQPASEQDYVLWDRALFLKPTGPQPYAGGAYPGWKIVDWKFAEFSGL